MAQESTIHIRIEPTMNYDLAVATLLNNGSEDVIIKACGRSISRAVGLAEMVRRR
jgi:DNA-binding protein Alba